MANLLEIAELAHQQLFPNQTDEVTIPLESFIASAKSEYAYQLWLKSKMDKREEGAFQVPSYLLSTAELDVKDNVADISQLKILRSLDNDMWLANVGGLGCKVQYVRSNVNHTQLLCDDDSMGDNVRTVLPIGEQLHFPKGVHTNPITIIYANRGEKINNNITVDDAIGAIIHRELINRYGAKVGRQDVTNNSNSNE